MLDSGPLEWDLGGVALGKGRMGSALMGTMGRMDTTNGGRSERDEGTNRDEWGHWKFHAFRKRDLLGVLPSTYFYLPKSARACPVSQPVKIHHFCSSPISVVYLIMLCYISLSLYIYIYNDYIIILYYILLVYITIYYLKLY